MLVTVGISLYILIPTVTEIVGTILYLEKKILLQIK